MRLPVIYVRGFAGSTSGIDKVIDDPFYGFNEGSVHVRVGGNNAPNFYQFESPMLRLMVDEDYQLLVRGSQMGYLREQPDGKVDQASIWVHRFYDESASTLGQKPSEFVVEKAAENLFELVKLVRTKTGAERVHLIAHSMGGLICRSMIQRVIPEATRRPDGAKDFVERLFTYGTPHGGIEFAIGFGMAEKLRDTFGIGGGEIFGPDRMYQYLTPNVPTPRPARRPRDWLPENMPADGFPRDRVFCLVGTNPEDYDVARGLSSKAVGARSDGLVQIDNAFVPGAPRALVHRSHSGRYGMVNSEEGYQNLRRFLFGDLRVVVELVGLQLAAPARGKNLVWQLETQLAIRGLPILMHEQTAAHHCPIQLQATATSVPLLTTFLDSHAKPSAAQTLRYALRLRVISLEERGGIFGFGDHLEQIGDFDDTLIVDVAAGDGQQPPRGWAQWNSKINGAIRDWQPDDKALLRDTEPAPGVWRGEIAVPSTAHKILGPAAAIRITVTPR